ncbi:histone acetyltransferase subunit NuA4-domain-containing protein [Pisolithus albus]|nr:histone acetyltransferase subunit NuA4-domain-containing protein [Pisolithus albus]
MASKDPPANPEDKARYDKVKEELVKMLAKKRAADRQLAQMELNIYNLETAYLTDTATTGNIIHGFDGYLKPTQGAAARRKHEIGEGDRWFSTSSGTWSRSLELLGDGEETTPAPDDPKTTNPGLTTVVVPPAPRPQELTAAQQKKFRDREYQRRKRALRRSAGTMSDDDSQAALGRRAQKRARLAEDE